MSERGRRVGMGLLFYPRGGGAQVVRYLSLALGARDRPVSLVSGSLGPPGERTHAPTFFTGLDVTAVDYDPAVAAWRAGRDPIAEPVPLHPSFEDRPDVPDRLLASVSPVLGDHLADAWERQLTSAWPDGPDLLHLHHLTPIQEAAARLWPGRPLITHLHGTEMKLLDSVESLSELSDSFGKDLEGMADAAEAGRLPEVNAAPEQWRELYRQTRFEQWRFGAHWAERLRAAAESSDLLVVSAPHDRDEVERLLGIAGERVRCVPNGVDISRFDRDAPSPEERLARWRRWLVEEPRGWDESMAPGTIRYQERDLAPFAAENGEAAPVILFVGRFTAVKRIPLLVRAYARARPRFTRQAPLVIWGGFPGELEGPHPLSVAREERVEGVYFAGWRDHDELPEGLAGADLLVAPSENESFGQVLIEAMACGLPVIATRNGGPVSFVNTDPGQPNGWLVEPNDVDGLAQALVEAVNDESARRERGDNAYEQIRGAYSWDAAAARFDELYETLAGAVKR